MTLGGSYRRRVVPRRTGPEVPAGMTFGDALTLMPEDLPEDVQARDRAISERVRVEVEQELEAARRERDREYRENLQDSDGNRIYYRKIN